MRLKSYQRAGEGFIKSPEEKERRSVAWGKYLYIVILIVATIALARWAYHKFFFVQGKGVLASETTNVEAKITARITSIKCKINDKVSAGDSLVILDKTEIENRIAAKERELDEKSHMFEQEILDAENKAKLLQEERRNRQKDVMNLKGEHKRAKDLLALEAVTRPQFLEIDYDLKSAEAELALASTEAALAKTKGDSLKKEFAAYRERLEKEIDQIRALFKETILLAPIDGVVTNIFQQEEEVAEVGKPILEIACLSENFIRTYFDGSDEDRIKPGGKVTVIFENGDKSSGRIAKVYPATFFLPPEFKKEYGGQGKFVVAEVVPETEKYWPRILQTRAEVLLKKKWL